jgi:hypothetical protein
MAAFASGGRGAFVPLAFMPGEAFQFDWSEDWAITARVVDSPSSSVPGDAWLGAVSDLLLQKGAPAAHFGVKWHYCVAERSRLRARRRASASSVEISSGQP